MLVKANQLCELIMWRLYRWSHENFDNNRLPELGCDNVIYPGEVLCPAVLVKTRVCLGCSVSRAQKPPFGRSYFVFAHLMTSVLASHADILISGVRHKFLTSAKTKNKFLSHCSQISAGNHMQIIGHPIGAVEIKVLTSQTHTYKLCRVWYVTKDSCSARESRR